MAERSFKSEVESLKLGDGETFHGEGIVAITKALLQSGVSYVGGYQGAPVSHLIDVLVDAEDLMSDLGVHLETCTSEASAAAMLGASINYPLRGAVTWKSIVGTNVAADALSNLASSGVMGGTMIILGEDYGEGASVIQERSHAFAMKSTMWLMDPRPNLTTMVDMVEKGFELSEASNTPVMMELRIRACHVHGSFVARDNKPGRYSGNRKLEISDFDYDRLAHPPSTFVQEKVKVEARAPRAQDYIVKNGLNELFDGELSDIGLILQGGLYNNVQRALSILGLSDAFGNCRIPQLILNVVHPLVPDQIKQFCAGKKAVLVIEEGNPEYIEQQIHTMLRRADIQTKIFGKDVLPMAGEYRTEVMLDGLSKFLAESAPGSVDGPALRKIAEDRLDATKAGAEAIGAGLPGRPPSFCTGCPERPVFSAIKVLDRELGRTHVSADIGCHAFATLPPFNMGNTILGYGMGLASSTGIAPNFDKRVISIMGDGGFWHNGLTTGVGSTMFNQDDSILIVMKNGYTSATGWQYLPNSMMNRQGQDPEMALEDAIKGLGVKWMRKVRTYSVAKMIATLREARTTAVGGLKVIIAEGECMLARQRRLRPENAKKLAAGERVVRTRFGVDDDVCTGDHSCIRLSGCPSLTIKPNPSPLRDDPVAHVNNDCVGCGLCGEVAHAAVLCPSFFQADIVQNANAWDRFVHRVRRAVIGALQGKPQGTQTTEASA
jgi:indolepyruvate ferredoxin oxidoreductase alpha subunit